MKILIAGNSQVGCLKEAYDADRTLFSEKTEVYFYVTPGASGPYLAIENGRLELTLLNEEFPPRISPPETIEAKIADFDLVVISALGYIDGGFRWLNPILSLANLSEFHPTTHQKPPVSDACYQNLVLESFRNHHGFRFLASLRQNYKGRIFVQPFPYTSEQILERDDWHFKLKYRSFNAAHRFFAETKNTALATLCDQYSAELLNYPKEEWSERHFTPSHLMRSTDCIHPTAEYGKYVLQQIACKIVHNGESNSNPS